MEVYLSLTFSGISSRELKKGLIPHMCVTHMEVSAPSHGDGVA